MNEQTFALVTGANQGIGYEIAAGLGALGWSVGVGDRNPQRQRDAVAKLRAGGTDAFPVPIDVTDGASVAAAARQIEEHPGRLDVLVNNTGATGASWPQKPTALDLDTDVRIRVQVRGRSMTGIRKVHRRSRQAHQGVTALPCRGATRPPCDSSGTLTLDQVNALG